LAQLDDEQLVNFFGSIVCNSRSAKLHKYLLAACTAFDRHEIWPTWEGVRRQVDERGNELGIEKPLDDARSIGEGT